MTDTITTLAAWRRQLEPGMVLDVDNRLHPHVSGPRTIEKIQTRSMMYRLADGRAGWIDWPKRGEYRVEGRTLHFLKADGDIAFSFTLPAHCMHCGYVVEFDHENGLRHAGSGLIGCGLDVDGNPTPETYAEATATQRVAQPSTPS